MSVAGQAFISHIRPSPETGSISFVPLPTVKQGENYGDVQGRLEASRLLTADSFPEFKQAMDRVARVAAVGAIVVQEGEESPELDPREWSVGRGAHTNEELSVYCTNDLTLFRDIEMRWYRHHTFSGSHRGSVGIGVEYGPLAQSVIFDEQGPYDSYYNMRFEPAKIHALREHLNLQSAPLYEVVLELATLIFVSQEFSWADLGRGLEIEFSDGQRQPNRQRLDWQGNRFYLRDHDVAQMAKDAASFHIKSLDAWDVIIRINAKRNEFLEISIGQPEYVIRTPPMPLKKGVLELWQLLSDIQLQ